MVNLLTVSPALLVIVVISIGMITLIANKLDEIRILSTRKILPRIFPRSVRQNITAIRLAYFALFGYAFIPFLSLICLATARNGSCYWFGDVIIWMLVLLSTFVVAWSAYYVASLIEKPQIPKDIPA